jgi:hypothetical protein
VLSGLIRSQAAVFKSGHLSGFNRGLESFQGICGFPEFLGRLAHCPLAANRSVQQVLTAALRSSLERLSRPENYL